MVSERGIEPNPDKIKAFLEMNPPSSYKDIKKLTRCLVALSRFISKYGEQNLPFFKNLRKALTNKFHWDDEFYTDFEDLKQYLGSPQLLSCPKEGEKLQLYLAVVKRAINNMLFAFALIVSARKLKPYFESHAIAVITDRSLKRILTNPALSGRMTTWAVELSEFDITYPPRRSMKAQVLADNVED
ncbi:hypothetical protein LIER_31156 [Lithospermum erythrorhizon]|uniref:Reverse transcriptase RNase H-like domain-containing protein n=1 Tax=Lithospermum erythrorhizon TaxID=34254 RepID=A0AAV3RTS9_LITER